MFNLFNFFEYLNFFKNHIILWFLVLFLKISVVFVLFFILDFDFLKFLPIIVPLILSIAFFTLFERKVLAAMQRRRGPNVVGYLGLLQAFADGFKLVGKETIIPSSSNFIIFVLSPIITFMLSLLGWAVIPFDSGIVITDTELGLIVLFTISSLGVYGVIMSGWSSNSKYAFLGALRSSAQMISYEVSMGLLIMPVIVLANSANLTNIVLSQESLYFIIPLFPSGVFFFISILAETNRLPFDLPEAESELVSGYNVEYSSITFALFFLAEYSSIILMCTLYVLLFLGGWLAPFGLTFIPCSIWLGLKVVFFMFCFIWVRATLPRYRYDQLMILGWKIILPVSFAFLMCTIIMQLIFIFYV